MHTPRLLIAAVSCAFVAALGSVPSAVLAKVKPPPAAPDGQDSEMDLTEEPEEEDLVLVEQVETEKLMIEALKSETTVEQAPAIVTVLSADYLKAMGHRWVADAMQDLPSFFTHPAFFHQGIGSMNRGVMVGSLVLHNSVDLYDASQGSPPLCENIPVQAIRSIEVISGPGGVLWGANSFVGVINIVGKTADDLDGVEASAGGGGGRGGPGAFYGYVMGGTKLFNDNLKLFGHVSYQSWHYPSLWWPNFIIQRSGAPNPMMPNVLAGPTSSDVARNHMVVLEGNAIWNDLGLYWHVPLGSFNRPSSFGGNAIHANLGEDNIDCTNPANKSICTDRVDPFRVARKTEWKIWELYGLLRYRKALLDDRLRVDARAFYVNYPRTMIRYTSLPPSEVLHDGVVVSQEYGAHRATFNFDTALKLPRNHRLMFSADVTYDIMLESRARWLISKENLARLPFYPACPPDEGDHYCPMVINPESDRLSYGAGLGWQAKLHPTLLVDAGARVGGAAAGKRPVDPILLLSGAAVWSFMPDWNLKLNYAEGYRNPPLSRMDSNGEGLTWGGNPDLVKERSRSIQGEVNAVLLRSYKKIKRLSFRADYAYTWIYDLIINISGINVNSSNQGAHTVELLMDLALTGDHWFSLGYTFLDMTDDTYGKVRTIPNGWGTVRSYINLWNRQLYLSSNLSIFGSCEDYNRIPRINAGQMLLGDVDANNLPVRVPVSISRPSDLSVDRIRPLPIWNAGLRLLLPGQNLRLDADFYNLLDATSFYPEGWMDLTTYWNSIVNPRPGFAFFLKAQYTYN